ncbi:MAG: hypothetical protein ACYTGH_07310, partial [Planctomycetota bacterium]
LYANAGYGEEAVGEILFHEGTHQLMHMYVGRRVPTWFNEGMATNFESFELTRSPESNRANAIYTSKRIYTLSKIYPSSGYVGFSRLKDISGRDWNGSSNPGANYASAWVACNFFLGTGDGRTLLNLLIKGFRSGKKQSKFINAKLTSRIEKKMGSYIETRVLPNLKYGRHALKATLERNDQTAKTLVTKMTEEYPKSPEGQFLSAWLDARNQETAGAALESLKKLDKNKDFEHPDMDMALAEAYANTGDSTQANKHAKAAAKSNLKHPLAKTFLEGLSSTKAAMK